MNKPRLIDVNALLDRLPYPIDYAESEFYGKILDVIEAISTVYDIDKVVEQLEEMETYKQTVTMEKHPFCASEIETVSKKTAIEIVKGNYPENPNSLKGSAE